MFQTPFSDRIRNEVGIATIAVGEIYEADHVNSIMMAGRADLCAWRGRISPIRPGPCMLPPARIRGFDLAPKPSQPGRDQLHRLKSRPDVMTGKV